MDFREPVTGQRKALHLPPRSALAMQCVFWFCVCVYIYLCMYVCHVCYIYQKHIHTLISSAKSNTTHKTHTAGRHATYGPTPLPPARGTSSTARASPARPAASHSRSVGSSRPCPCPFQPFPARALGGGGKGPACVRSPIAALRAHRRRGGRIWRGAGAGMGCVVCGVYAYIITPTTEQ